MKKPFLLKPYALAWKLARPLLRRHKRLAAHFEERLVPKGWPNDFMPAICGLDTVHPPYRLWIHAASGGEAYLAREIVAELAPRLKELAIICTSMTEQGIEVLSKAQQEFSHSNCFIAVNYFPLDEPGLMRRALEQSFGPPSQAPRGVVFLETEIWPGLLSACRDFGVRAYILNGRMTEGSHRSYRRIAGALRRLAPRDVMATGAKDVERFRDIFDQPGGPSRVSLMPNIKFDRVSPAGDGNKSLLSGLLPEKPLQVALLASVRAEEEAELQTVIDSLREKAPQCCVIVAPRHLHRAEAWAGRLSGLKGFKRRSRGVEGLESGDVVLWDAFGELMALYGLATTAFVGGSLAPLGGQNFLEPLSFGVVPVIGPSWSNFYWVGGEPFKSGLVRQVENAAGLADALLEQLKSPPDKYAIKSAFAGYLKRHQGGARHAADFLLKELWGA